jgi:hypothetical protein
MTLGPIVLLVVGAAALLGVMIRRLGSAGRTRGAPTLPLARGPHHLHYCTTHDRQWEHEGASHECTRYWTAPCPLCTAPAGPTASPA